MSNKKKLQLGMNPSTASGRLVKDILWNFIQLSGQNSCFHCQCEMTRENFSIEHKIPWLDSDDPVGLYFDMNNISFSHHSCNVKSARNARKKYFTEEERKKAKRARERLVPYNSDKRREQYLRTGK